MHLHTCVASLHLLVVSLVAAQNAAPSVPPGYAGNWRPLVKDDDIVSENFKEVDIEILSPAFLYPNDRPRGFTNGTSGASSDVQLDNFLRNLASRNDWMDYINPDFLSEEGRSFPYIYLSSSDKGYDASKNDTKLRLLIESNLHGDEPAPEEAVLSLLGKMDDDPTWARSILQKLDIMIIPRASPDGVAYFQSQLASGYNPNRDFSAMQSQQTRDLISLYTKFAPHIFVDCHEFGANWRFGKEGTWIVAVDAEVNSGGTLNRHPDIFDLEFHLFMRNMYAAMERNDLRTSQYFTAEMNSSDLTDTAPNGQYATSHNSMRQAISILIEARGVRLGDQHFQRRVAAIHVLLIELIKTATENSDHVYQTIEDARNDFIASNKDIAITSKPRNDTTSWQWIDANNGSVIEAEVTYQNYTPPAINLTRSRPEAYVFSHAWAGVAERLRVSGVKVQQLDFTFHAEVEALVVETSTLATELFEGIVKNTVSTSSFTRTVTIPAGAFWVSTRQVNAAFAMTFLEPEDVASAVTYNIVPLIEGDEYPIYRVLKSGHE